MVFLTVIISKSVFWKIYVGIIKGKGKPLQKEVSRHLSNSYNDVRGRTPSWMHIQDLLMFISEAAHALQISSELVLLSLLAALT